MNKKIFIFTSIFLFVLSLSACGNNKNTIIDKGKAVDKVSFKILDEEINITSNDDPVNVYKLFNDKYITFKLNKTKGWQGKKIINQNVSYKNYYNITSKKLENYNFKADAITQVKDYTYLEFADNKTAFSYETNQTINNEKDIKKLDLYIDQYQISSTDKYYDLDLGGLISNQIRLDMYYNSSNYLDYEGIKKKGLLSCNYYYSDNDYKEEENYLYYELKNSYANTVGLFDIEDTLDIPENERLNKFANYKFELTDKYIILNLRINLLRNTFIYLNSRSSLLESYSDKELNELSKEGYHTYTYYVDYNNLKENSKTMYLDYMEYEEVTNINTEFTYDEIEEYNGIICKATGKTREKEYCYVLNTNENEYNKFIKDLKSKAN
ncbi:MAG: hypothetical protein IJA65_00260 [Acholeplasmatales bacterium]|nr:hypothetical protein [Acholeplasmatales bacterium]